MAAFDKAKLARRVAKLIIGFTVSLAIGKAVEVITNADTLQHIQQVQSGWIAAVRRMSPLSLFDVFVEQFLAAFETLKIGGTWGMILTPLVALWNTVWSYFGAGALASLVQIGMGALVVAAINMSVSRSKTIFFETGIANILGLPLAIIAAASGLAFVLQTIMLGGLEAFHWITGLAGMAAGATGVIGFCWYCFVKLSEKGTEHLLTPSI